MTPLAPIGSHQLLVLLLQIAVLLGTALLLGRLAVRLGAPAVVGELFAGVVLGPSLLGHLSPGLSGWLLPHDVGQQHLLDAVGQLGVLLLVGITGMHIDVTTLRRQGPKAAAVSAGGLLVPLALGVGVAFLLPASMLGAAADRGTFAFFLGVALCVSAIPVIAKTLLEMRLLHREVGQLIMTAAAVDDIVGWFLLSVVSATVATGVHTGQILVSLGYLAVAVAFTVFAGRPLVHTCLRLAARTGDAGVGIATVVVLLVFASAGTHALGMEPILGAFLFGIVAGSSKHLDPVQVAPLRTFVLAVLAPLFFATAGLRMDLTALREPAVAAAATGVLLVAIGGKFLGAYAGARLSRLGHWPGLAVGAGLNARGVVEVVVAMVGLRLGILNTASFTIIVLIAIVTSVMAPPMLRWSARHIALTPAELARERVTAA